MSRNIIHTEDGISVKMPSKDLSNDMIKGLKKKKIKMCLKDVI